jgi:hypothetical protein
LFGEGLACVFCGQDRLACFRVRSDGREFLLCPECDSVWLPGDDPRAQPVRWLGDLFDTGPRTDHWDLIERCGAGR